MLAKIRPFRNKNLMESEKIDKLIEEWQKDLSYGEILPFYQPILSLEKKEVFGHEALGRIRYNNAQVYSLGNFFLQESIKEHEFNELQKDIDRKLRISAIDSLTTDKNPNSKIFLNISPAIMMSYIEQIKDGKLPIPHTIVRVKELGIEPNRIVIEITEAYIHKNLEYLRPLIEMYKDFGFLIAVDDLGSKASNLDRIGIFKPDIIKVDMQLLRMSMFERSYKEILYTISKLSESLGISILFEGVETGEELNQAMSFGARYVQGFLFSKAKESLSEKNEFKEKLELYLEKFHDLKQYEIRQKVIWEENIKTKLTELIKEISLDENGNLESNSKIFDIDKDILRFYVTDLKGNQVSPNYIKEYDQIFINEEKKNRSNWTWRPYFLNHIYESSKSNSWIFSQPYHDIEKDILLRTFSKTFLNKLILFLDINYKE